MDEGWIDGSIGIEPLSEGRDERRRSISRERHRPLLSSKTFPGLSPENRRCLKREPQAQIGGVGGLPSSISVSVSI